MSAWLGFLRHYGPIARNDNMYDETIQRVVSRSGIAPIEFEHPMQAKVVSCFNRTTPDPVSVILTGTAGDGKSHLCRQVWTLLGGDDAAWGSDSPYFTLDFQYPKDRVTWPESADQELYRLVKIQRVRCQPDAPVVS
jgi:hypothetical protein